MSAPALPRLRGLKKLPVLVIWAVIGVVMPAPARAAPDATPIELDFRDLLASPVGERGPRFSPALLAADGRRVRIAGHMVVQERGHPGRFFLAPRPLAMSEHADGEADDLPPTVLTVLMPPEDAEVTPLPTRGRLLLTGTLRVGRAELEEGRIVWLRLELDPRHP